MSAGKVDSHKHIKDITLQYVRQLRRHRQVIFMKMCGTSLSFQNMWNTLWMLATPKQQSDTGAPNGWSVDRALVESALDTFSPLPLSLFPINLQNSLRKSIKESSSALSILCAVFLHLTTISKLLFYIKQFVAYTWKTLIFDIYSQLSW